MNVLLKPWKALVALGLYKEHGVLGLDAATLYPQILGEVPPNPALGDLAFPLFPFAKVLRKGPPQLASSLVQVIGGDDFVGFIRGLSSQAMEPILRDLADTPFTSLDKLATALGRGDLGQAHPAGPYVNIRYNRPQAVGLLFEAMDAATKSHGAWGNNGSLAGKRVLVEFSSPNTNKPLHLGHLRNNTLGEASARILRANGAEVKTVNLFNDRGIHICKSMLAYQRWGEGADPVKLGKKPDHYVAQLYVRYQQELKEQISALKAAKPELADSDEDAIWLQTEIGASAQALLVAWEQGDTAVRSLWETMNAWAVGGIMQTYTRTGITFDWVQFEHQTYMLGKGQVEKGLASGAFSRRADGAIVVDLPWKDNAKSESNAQKVVLRADGTSIYLTQDLGTAIKRHEEWPFDQAVYVVASEQDYHFKVLFHCLKVLGHQWAERLYHLSYGLVNLPSGRMKTREGTVVDADLLIDELRDLAVQAIKEKEREEAVGDPQAIAEKVALAALHYYLLQTSPGKDMIFNPEESLAFSGNTGPYLQYMGARVSSMLRKWTSPVPTLDAIDPSLLSSDQEWEVLGVLAQWPRIIEQAGANYNPSLLATALYDLAKAYSRFYHDLPILNAPDQAMVKARLYLSNCVLQTLRHGMGLLNIPFLDVM